MSEQPHTGGVYMMMEALKNPSRHVVITQGRRFGKTLLFKQFLEYEQTRVVMKRFTRGAW